VLDALEEEATALIVGHEPSIHTMANHLCGVSFGGFRTGMACVVQWHRESGALEWLVDPESLRSMDRI
jgi:phosphohistidine phosphatase SixA